LHQNVLNKTKYFICKTSTEFSEAQERTLVDFILNKKLEFSTRIITPGLPMILTLIIVQTIVLVLTLSLVLTVALVLTVMINLNEARKICHLCQTHQTPKTNKARSTASIALVGVAMIACHKRLLVFSQHIAALVAVQKIKKMYFITNFNI